MAVASSGLHRISSYRLVGTQDIIVSNTSSSYTHPGQHFQSICLAYVVIWKKCEKKGVVSNKQGGMIDIFRQQTTLDHGVGFADTTSKLSDFDKSGHIGSLCSSPGRASSKDGQITTQHAASTIGRRGSAR